jgi:NTP pyrophosphatase (non-canonical NTP hydrolase)
VPQDLNEGSLNALAERIYENAKKHGFYEKNDNILEALMFIVSEVGEACEALRKGRRFDGVRKTAKVLSGNLSKETFECAVKDTFEDELADAMIRLLGLAYSVGMDIDFHIREKMRHNENRPFLHGKLF